MVEKKLGLEDKLVYFYSEKPYFGGDKAFVSSPSLLCSEAAVSFQKPGSGGNFSNE
jgi:hypothetical protein